MKLVLIVIPALSFLLAALNGRMDAVSEAVLDKSGEAVTLVISLCGIICFWSGLMRVAQKAGLLRKLSAVLSPVVSFLFCGIKRGSRAAELISMNLAANILGLGNATTPLGIAAMKELASDYDGAATDNMIMLAVLNTASLQLIPTTAAALRAANGSPKPFDILPCVWITSLYSLILVVAAAKLLGYISKKRCKP